MGNQYSIEFIRAWSDGNLDENARAQFEKQLASDSELRAVAEAYRDVHHMSDGEGDALPTSALQLEELEASIESEAVRRLVPLYRSLAIAAGILALAGAAWLWNGSDRSTRREPVKLVTIPLSTNELSASVALPATLANYHPVADGEIQWVREAEEADRIASATGRPLLVFGRYSQCGLADEKELSMTEDKELQELAEQCVPLIVELDQMEESERERLVANGYPSIQIKSADGTETISLTKETAGYDLKERIRKGIGSCQKESVCTQTWKQSRELAALCESARLAESEGRLAEAHRSYEKLVASGGSGLLSEAGERGLVRIALEARDSLLDARALCEKDSKGATRLLAAAVERFENTPHVAELEQVLDAVRRTGEFPTLAWAPN